MALFRLDVDPRVPARPQHLGQSPRVRAIRLDYARLDRVGSAARIHYHYRQTQRLKLPRQPGTKESRYAHLLSGEVEVEVVEPRTFAVSTAVGRAEQDRLSRMEEELQALRREVEELKEGFAAFRKQFE